MSDNPPRPVAFSTRFLYPFVVPAAKRGACIDALRGDTFLGKPDAWRQDPPHRYYQDELLPQVAHYVHPGQGQSGCVLLRLAPDRQDRLLRDVTAQARKGQTTFGVAWSSLAGVELFISPEGAGVLSVALDVTPGGQAEGKGPAELTGDHALDFNYLGARRHKGVDLLFVADHPSSDPERWNRIPAEARERLERQRPEANAPIDARLGVPGGWFTLADLATRLLSPLGPLGLRRPNTLDNEQPVPFVFTVLRFDASVDFDDARPRRALASLGAGLAQVEEAHHPGSVSDDLGVPAAYLSRKHWALLGQLGAAHLVADQPPGPDGKPIAFNEERATRVFMKYFIPTLLALLQRSTLQDAGERAARLAEPGQMGDPAHRSVLWELRHELLRFAARGHFAQVSTRHAVQRSYLLAREGLAVETQWDSIRGAVGELDAAHTARAQEKLAADSNAMQRGLHLFEYFFFIVYCAELAHLLLQAFAESLRADDRVHAVHSLHSLGWLAILTAMGFGLFLARFLTRSVGDGHHG